MSILDKLWGVHQSPSEEYTKKSSWFSRFQDPLFWGSTIFTGGLIVAGIFTGLIIPFAVVSGVLGLLEVTGVLGYMREKFWGSQLKKQLRKMYTTQYKSTINDEEHSLTFEPTENAVISGFQDDENPSLTEQQQRWQAYGQQVLKVFSGDGEQDSPYETPFILYCACFPEKKRLDFSAFRCTDSSEKRQRWNRFIHQLLINNPHLVDLSFHLEDWDYIDTSIKETLQTRKACYVAEKISTTEQAIPENITNERDKEAVHLFYRSEASKRYAQYTEARQQQFHQLLSLSGLNPETNDDYKTMNDKVNRELTTLNSQSVPTKLEQKKRPSLFELRRFFEASNHLTQSFKTVFDEIGERLSSLQLSILSGSTDSVSHESFDENESSSPPLMNITRIDKNTPESQRQQAFLNEANRINVLWGDRPLEGDDPGGVLDPELETVLCEILWGPDSLCDWDRKDIDMLRQKQFMFHEDKREDKLPKHKDTQDKTILILNHIATAYATWYNLPSEYSDSRKIYLNNYCEAFIGCKGGILEERQQLTHDFKVIKETNQSIAHSYKEIAHSYKEIAHSYGKLYEEAKQINQDIDDGKISLDHLSHLTYEQKVAMIEQIEEEARLETESRRKNLDNDSEPRKSLSYGENPQNFYTSQKKQTQKPPEKSAYNPYSDAIKTVMTYGGPK